MDDEKMMFSLAWRFRCRWEYICWVLSTPRLERLLEQAYGSGQMISEADEPRVVPRRYKKPHLAVEWLRGYDGVQVDHDLLRYGG